jgi:hypothetical protein
MTTLVTRLPLLALCAIVVCLVAIGASVSPILPYPPPPPSCPLMLLSLLRPLTRCTPFVCPPSSDSSRRTIPTNNMPSASSFFRCDHLSPYTHPSHRLPTPTTLPDNTTRCTTASPLKRCCQPPPTCSSHCPQLPHQHPTVPSMASHHHHP